MPTITNLSGASLSCVSPRIVFTSSWPGPYIALRISGKYQVDITQQEALTLAQSLLEKVRFLRTPVQRVEDDADTPQDTEQEGRVV